MNRIAIPVFQSRVSPVFDSSKQVFLVDIDRDREIERRQLDLIDFTLTERVTYLKRLGVTTVICGGISSMLHNMLKRAKISLIDGIAGDVEEILRAFMSERLEDPCYYMPGYKERKEKLYR